VSQGLKVKQTQNRSVTPEHETPPKPQVRLLLAKQYPTVHIPERIWGKHNNHTSQQTL